MPEPLVGARPLAEDGADHRDHGGDLGAAEQERQRRRDLDPAQGLRAAGVERAHHPRQLRVHRSQAVERVDGDREEADQRDDRQLRPDPEAEPDDEDRRDRDHGHRLRGDQQRVEARAAASRRGAARSRSAKPSDERDREAEQHLLHRHPRVVEASSSRSSPERLRDVARRRDQERLDVRARRRSGPSAPPAPRAPSRTARATIGAARSQRLIAAPRRAAPPAPARGPP